MKPSVYVETTIPSFVVGEISEIFVTAARQFTTRRWWREEREKISAVRFGDRGI
jgi:hypothetical protein